MESKENAETRAPETTPGEPADYRECLYRVVEELRLMRVENDELHIKSDRLRALLRPAWLQWHAEVFKDDLVDDAVRNVLFTVGELRAIAALFTEEDDA